MKAELLTKKASPQTQKGFVKALESRMKVCLLSASYQGKPVFFYLKPYSHNRLKQKLLLKKSFKPAEYGKILACGYNSPSPALAKKMEKEFKISVLVPLSKPSVFSSDC